MHNNTDSVSFTLQKQICFDDDHFNQCYAELYPSNLLIKKLEKNLLKEKPNYILLKDPTPEFFTTYDLIKGTVFVLARCTITNCSKRFSENISIPLTTQEADLLIACIEDNCRQLHNGKDCLFVLNEARQRVGRDVLK